MDSLHDTDRPIFNEFSDQNKFEARKLKIYASGNERV